MLGQDDELYLEGIREPRAADRVPSHKERNEGICWVRSGEGEEVLGRDKGLG